MDERFRQALEEFILSRIQAHEADESEQLEEARKRMDEEIQKADREKTLSNVLGLLVGELTDTYYRAGFADAVAFLMSWNEKR